MAHIKAGTSTAVVAVGVAVTRIREKIEEQRAYIPAEIDEDDYKSKNQKNLVDHIETATDMLEFSSKIRSTLNDFEMDQETETNAQAMQKMKETIKEGCNKAISAVSHKAKEYYADYGMDMDRDQDIIFPQIEYIDEGKEAELMQEPVALDLDAKEEQKAEPQPEPDQEPEPGAMNHVDVMAAAQGAENDAVAEHAPIAHQQPGAQIAHARPKGVSEMDELLKYFIIFATVVVGLIIVSKRR